MRTLRERLTRRVGEGAALGTAVRRPHSAIEHHNGDRGQHTRGLRRFSTADIPRVPAGDGRLSRLGLSETRRPARNTFLERHSPTVLHDTRRDVFYRITDDGLRRITNEQVLRKLRQQGHERGLHREGRRLVSREPRHTPLRREIHREREHDEHHGFGRRFAHHRDHDDHFFVGVGIGDLHYPYNGFYFGYGHGWPYYYPTPYEPFLYEPWYVHGWPIYRTSYFDEHFYLDIAVGTATYWWAAPSVVLMPPAVYPVVFGSILALGPTYVYSPTYSQATYSVDGQVVASTQAAQPPASSPPSPRPAQQEATSPQQQGGVAPSLLDEFDALAEEAFKRGDYELAAKYWRHALLEDPQNGLLLLLMGQALFGAGKYREAAGAVQAGMALLNEKDWGVVVENWRELYPDAGEYTRQLRALEDAVRKNTRDPALRFLLGYHYGYLGYPADAARELGYLKELAPQDKIGLRLYELMQQKVTKKPGTSSASGQQGSSNSSGQKQTDRTSSHQGTTDEAKENATGKQNQPS